MNERVRELAEQAGIDFFNSTDPEYYGRVYCEGWTEQQQKFAELIVQECINTIDPKTGTKWIKDQTQEEFWKNQSVHLIKQHFGVEQ